MDHIDEGHNIDDWFTFNVTIFAPSPEKGRLLPQELGQLFHDFNYKVSRVSPTQALELDMAVFAHPRFSPRLRDGLAMRCRPAR